MLDFDLSWTLESELSAKVGRVIPTHSQPAPNTHFQEFSLVSHMAALEPQVAWPTKPRGPYALNGGADTVRKP